MDEKELRFSSDEDKKFYDSCVRNLPTVSGFAGTGRDARGIPIPFGCGPHGVKWLREVCEIVKPVSILEIGFNLGFSASLWLSLTSAKLTSVEISDKPETMFSAGVIKERFGDRFRFIQADSSKALPILGSLRFDLIFIDGGHLEPDVQADINLARALGIPNVCFDDWIPQYGPGVQPAIAKSNLEIVKILGNIALTKWKERK